MRKRTTGTYGKPRCESVHREGKRSWRCTKDAGHDTEPLPDGINRHVAAARRMHSSPAGGRRWR